MWMEGRHMEMSIRNSTPSTTVKETEKEKFLSKFNRNVVHICGQCRQILIFSWREVRQSFNQNAIAGKPGRISNADFFSILRKFNVSVAGEVEVELTKAFRLDRSGTVIRFDEFLKVCFLTRKDK